MLDRIANIFRIAELRKRLFFSLGLLAIYRLGIFVTTPGVDREAMAQYLNSAGGLLSLFNLFSGGALEQLSIFALGIMPYISSSIIMQLLGIVIPALAKLQKEGEIGRRKITQYTRYGTILLSVIQGFSIAFYLESIGKNDPAMGALAAGIEVVHTPGWGFRLLTVLTLTAGTAFIMWLGEQITERGIGNGISLIIFAGIVARLPDAVIEIFMQIRSGSEMMKPTNLAILAVVMLATITFIVFFERGQRRIPIQYAKRIVGRKTYGGQSTHLPLKVNTAGVIPPIFASSILMFPATVGNWIPFLKNISDILNRGGWIYNSIYVALIIGFTYFYTAVTFNPVDVADNLKKNGGYIPGIRPGQATADHIDKVLTRITFGGALYLSLVCILPSIIMNQFGVSFYFGGTSLLIVVGVALDTAQQIEGHLITRNYEGFTGVHGPRIRGRMASLPRAAS